MVQINKFVSLFSNMNYQSQSEDYKTGDFPEQTIRTSWFTNVAFVFSEYAGINMRKTKYKSNTIKSACHSCAFTK